MPDAEIIEAARVGPDDALVVRLEAAVPNEFVERVAAELDRIAPGRCLVLHGDAELRVISRQGSTGG